MPRKVDMTIVQTKWMKEAIVKKARVYAENLVMKSWTDMMKLDFSRNWIIRNLEI